MKNTNTLFKALTAGFIIAVVFSMAGFGAEMEDIQGKVVRLHVLANSDSKYDQDIKLKVKDRVFALATELTASCESPEEAESVLKNNIDIIGAEANQALRDLSAPYTATAQVVEDYFSTREYDTFTLPAGEYSALRVNLGEGKGHNWWCAVYPAVCTSACADFDGFTESEKEKVTGKEKYRIEFKFYEIYRNFLRWVS